MGDALAEFFFPGITLFSEPNIFFHLSKFFFREGEKKLGVLGDFKQGITPFFAKKNASPID